MWRYKKIINFDQLNEAHGGVVKRGLSNANTYQNLVKLSTKDEDVNFC